MKRLAIMVALVLASAAAICVGALWYLNGVLEEAHGLSTEIFVSMEEGNITAVREKLVELAAVWEENSGLMETFCDHDDLHEVKQRIIEAEICMQYTDMEDFYSSIALIGEGIEHIRDEEALSWTNLM